MKYSGHSSQPARKTREEGGIQFVPVLMSDVVAAFVKGSSL